MFLSRRSRWIESDVSPMWHMAERNLQRVIFKGSKVIVLMKCVPARAYCHEKVLWIPNIVVDSGEDGDTCLFSSGMRDVCYCDLLPCT